MSSYLDYDYPCNLSRPVNSSAIGPSGTSSAAASPNSTTNVTSHPNATNKFRALIQQAHSTQKSIQLQSVVPLAKLSTPSGCYYDVPRKNIPVDPRFASQTTAPVGIPKFPVNSHLLHERPQLPQKSSIVRNKMNYMNSPVASHTLQTNIEKPPAVLVPALTKQNTAKPLPPLPGAAGARAIADYALYTDIPLPSKGDVVDSAAKYKFTDIYSAQDDDEEDCDYDYDYVCLESKKKLDDEDEKVKTIISKDMQFKYQRLVQSSGLDLQNLERSLQHSSTLNSNIKKQFLQSYRHFLSVSLKNFESWILLSLEIILRNHQPNVYINFTKHILLSGQNLLLVAKSLNRHYGQIQSLSLFADSFYDYLRQIVLKTKRAASEHSNTKLIDEMMDSLKSAQQFTKHLNVELLQ